MIPRYSAQPHELPVCPFCHTRHDVPLCHGPNAWPVPPDVVLTQHPTLRTPANWERYESSDSRRLSTRQEATARRIIEEALS